MANDVAAAIVDALPTSSVWLVIYRYYNHEEGIATRKADNGFYFKHFGGDRHNVCVHLQDAPEIYCASTQSAANHLWSLVNVLKRPQGLEFVFLPQTPALNLVSESQTVWKIGTAEWEKESFLVQVLPLLETLEHVRMK